MTKSSHKLLPLLLLLLLLLLCYISIVCSNGEQYSLLCLLEQIVHRLIRSDLGCIFFDDFPGAIVPRSRMAILSPFSLVYRDVHTSRKTGCYGNLYR